MAGTARNIADNVTLLLAVLERPNPSGCREEAGSPSCNISPLALPKPGFTIVGRFRGPTRGHRPPVPRWTTAQVGHAVVGSPMSGHRCYIGGRDSGEPKPVSP